MDELKASVRGVAARVGAPVPIVTRADGVDVVEHLRDHGAIHHTDDETLQRWRWVDDGQGVWWDVGVPLF